MTEIGFALVKALFITIVIEEIAALFWREWSLKLALVVFVMNVLTNPAINAFVYNAPDFFYQSDLHYYILTTFLEFCVWFVEWRILAQTGVGLNESRAALMSLTLNACSYFSAWPLQWLGFWG